MGTLEIDCRSTEWTSAYTPSDVSRQVPMRGHARAIWHDLPGPAREGVKERPALGQLLALVQSTSPSSMLCPGLASTVIALGPGATW